MDFHRFEVVSFDCYGTLIDWERGILAALEPLLAGRGIVLEPEELLERYGGFESSIQAGGYCRYREVLAAVVDAFGEHYGFIPDGDERASLARSLPDWPPFADTTEALRRLQARYRLAILSNVDDDLFAGTRERLGVEFDHVITAERIGAYKPDPRNFAALIERTGGKGDAILHVAQSLFHDIGPAAEAGLATVWVRRRSAREGFGATPPAQAKPDLTVRDLAGLVERIEAG